jgi:hypothetical protein
LGLGAPAEFCTAGIGDYSAFVSCLVDNLSTDLFWKHTGAWSTGASDMTTSFTMLSLMEVAGIGLIITACSNGKIEEVTSGWGDTFSGGKFVFCSAMLKSQWLQWLR